MRTFQVLFFVHFLAYSPLTNAKRINLSPRVAGKVVSTDANQQEESIGPTKDPVRESLVHRCVMQRAEDFPALLGRLNIEVPRAFGGEYLALKSLDINIPDDVNGNSIVTLVDNIVAIKDMEHHRHASRGALGNWLHWDSFSSSATKWADMLNALEEELQEWGFSYEAASYRCGKGSNDESYDCMVGKTGQADSSSLTAEVRAELKERIDIKDVLVQPVAAKGSKDYDRLWTRVAALDNQLELAQYDWSGKKYECRKVMDNEVHKIKDNLMVQLSQGHTEKSAGTETCVENPKGMCPEGTYATTQRRRDSIKGGAILAVTYPLLKFSMAPLGYAAGTAVAGPAGAAAGGLAASSMGAGLAIAISYWASLGPEECACFIRDCGFDAEEGGCRLVTEDDAGAPTKNQYAKALPMSGMKCELVYKSKDTCMMTQCGNTDFSDPITGLNLKGKLGRDGAGIYNCLSKNGEPTGALSLDSKVDGKDNTIQNRVSLYESLPDQVTRFGELPTQQKKECRQGTITNSSAWWYTCDYDNMHKVEDGCQCNDGWQYDEGTKRCEWCGLGAEEDCFDNADIVGSRRWFRCADDHMHKSKDGKFCRCDTGYQWDIVDAEGKCLPCAWNHVDA